MSGLDALVDRLNLVIDEYYEVIDTLVRETSIDYVNKNVSEKAYILHYLLQSSVDLRTVKYDFADVLMMADEMIDKCRVILAEIYRSDRSRVELRKYHAMKLKEDLKI